MDFRFLKHYSDLAITRLICEVVLPIFPIGLDFIREAHVTQISLSWFLANVVYWLCVGLAIPYRIPILLNILFYVGITSLFLYCAKYQDIYHWVENQWNIKNSIFCITLFYIAYGCASVLITAYRETLLHMIKEKYIR